MKRLIVLALLASSAFAQYVVIPSSSYPALDAILNAKLAFTTGSGAPGGSCTYGKDVYTDTVTGNMSWCTATNVWTLMINASVAQTMTNKTVDGISPTIFTYLATISSDIQAQVTAKAPLASPALSGVPTVPTATLGTNTTQAASTAFVLANAGTGGSLLMSTGTGAPVSSCAAPTSSLLLEYVDTTNFDLWFCSATNSWKKVLSTTNSGVYVETGLAGTAPSNPASGSVTCYFSSVSLTQICLDTSGNAFTMVKGASAITANFLTNIDAAGIQHFAPITKSIAAFIFDGGGVALSGTLDACRVMDAAYTITGATLISDVSGSATVDVRTVAYSSYTGPSSASTITASAIPALASATKYQDTTLTGWNTAIPANTVVCFHLTSPATATWVMADLKGN